MTIRVMGCMAAVLVAGLVSLSGCGSGGGESSEAEPVGPTVSGAYSKCTPIVAIASDKAGQSAQFAFDAQKPDHMESMWCVLRELEAPASVELKVNETSPMMGAQEASWGDVTMTWSYENDPLPMVTVVLEGSP